MRIAFALVLALLGVAAFHNGLVVRERAEPAGLATGPGLLVGTETAADIEVRGRPLTEPSPLLRRSGGTQRSLGTGLMALALALVALRPVRPGARPGARWVRLVWFAPGALAIVRLVLHAGASAPTAALAREAYVEAIALYGLSFVLLAAWRA